jgi:hypothetical protein
VRPDSDSFVLALLWRSDDLRMFQSSSACVDRRKPGLLIIFVLITPAAQTDFLALWLRFHADPATHRGNCLQFFRRVVPLAFDSGAFIEIELQRELCCDRTVMKSLRQFLLNCIHDCKG